MTYGDDLFTPDGHLVAPGSNGSLLIISASSAQMKLLKHTAAEMSSTFGVNRCYELGRYIYTYIASFRSQCMYVYIYTYESNRNCRSNQGFGTHRGARQSELLCQGRLFDAPTLLLEVSNICVIHQRVGGLPTFHAGIPPSIPAQLRGPGV